MLDVFNIMNSGVPTTVRTTNTAAAPFNDVTAILNPRVIRFGVPLQLLVKTVRR